MRYTIIESVITSKMPWKASFKQEVLSSFLSRVCCASGERDPAVELQGDAYFLLFFEKPFL